MKANSLLLGALFAAASALAAAPVAELTAIHAQPDANSAVLGLLQAGAEPVVATPATPAPAGWMAVELPGPHEGFVQNKSIDKGLAIDPGSPVYTAPRADAPVLTTIAKGDATDITGLLGDWTQITVKKKIIGYIATAPAPAAAPPAPGPSVAPAAADTSFASAPVVMPGRPVAVGDTTALPRSFQGTFDVARGWFTTPPYPYELKDNSGSRYAYVDISHLLLTDQIVKYIGRTVTVSGTAKTLPDNQGIVIIAENLLLR